MKEQFGLRLQNLCDKHNYDYKEVSKMLGYSDNTFGQYVRGERTPDFLTLIKIADIFQVSLDYLLRGEEPYQDYFNKLAPIFRRTGIENRSISKIEKWQSLTHKQVNEIADYFEWVLGRPKE